jgi:hypothetical protein
MLATVESSDSSRYLVQLVLTSNRITEIEGYNTRMLKGNVLSVGAYATLKVAFTSICQTLVRWFDPIKSRSRSILAGVVYGFYHHQGFLTLSRSEEGGVQTTFAGLPHECETLMAPVPATD